MKKIAVCLAVIVVVLLIAYACGRMQNTGNETAAPADDAEKPAPAVNQTETTEESAAEETVKPEENTEEVKEEPKKVEEKPAETVKPDLKPTQKSIGKREKAPVKPKEPENTIPTKSETAKKSEKPVLGKKASDEGTIDSAGVMKVIRASNAAIKRCYDKALISNPSLKGKISVKIVVNMEGRVGSVELSEDTLQNAEVAKCVKGVIGRLRFPKPEGGPAPIVYPYSFTR